MRIWGRGLLFWVTRVSGFFYISPSNFNYWYNFGVLALYFLVAQIVSGVFLAMFYDPNALNAFASINVIGHEIYYGWWVRYLHSNGASWFFLVVYIHMFRGLYYGSFTYPRQLLWYSGVGIWFFMIATAFLGYVLPWGQMSFWAAMVITSLLGAIPMVGPDILLLLWGGFSIDDFTLHRFYSLHYFFPFIIVALVALHLIFLHEFGSSNPLGISSKLDHIPLFPYYGLKDFYAVNLAWFLFFFIFFLAPDLLGHSDNYNEANPLVTPTHIVPEWYFLPLYAVLRSVTNKILGILLIFSFILSLFLMPWFVKGTTIRSGMFRPFFNIIFWFFFFDALLLGWIGGLPVMVPYVQIVNFVHSFFLLLFWFYFQVFAILRGLSMIFIFFVQKIYQKNLNFSNLC